MSDGIYRGLIAGMSIILIVLLGLFFGKTFGQRMNRKNQARLSLSLWRRPIIRPKTRVGHSLRYPAGIRSDAVAKYPISRRASAKYVSLF